MYNLQLYRMLCKTFFEKSFLRNPPAKNTIIKNDRKYSDYGTRLTETMIIRRKYLKTILRLSALHQQNSRNVSALPYPIGMWRSSSDRITRLDLQWHPYRMHVRHKLLPNDIPLRLRLLERFSQRCPKPESTYFLTGDQASFVMNG